MKILRGANLRDADLYRADLYRADLYGADLQGADLQGADLYGANLQGAILEDADLRGANLHHANLDRANLRDADLRFANLHHADLQNADLCGAVLDGITVSWCSHQLISEILFRAADGDRQREALAGFVRIKTDWNWPEFLHMENSLKSWALAELAKWLKPDETAPWAPSRYGDDR